MVWFALFLNKCFFCLWNPATREYKEIPGPNLEYHVGMVGFGYDYKSNDYKLLAAGNVSFGNLFEVFSLNSNSWRTIENVQYDWPISVPGVLVNGELHWLVGSKYYSGVILVCLDISNDLFIEMELPKEPLDEYWNSRLAFHNLGVVEGCLCLLVVDDNVCVQIWVMQNYGVGESWTKRYTINHERISSTDSTFRLMWSLKSGEILFGGEYTGLLLYIPSADKVISPNIYSLTMVHQEERYFESLVSLKSASLVSPTMAETLILRGTLVGHNDMVTSIACPIDNSDMIVSSSCEKSILVWTLSKQEVSYGVPKLRLTGHNHSVQDVALSSDAQFALSGSSDGELRLWDLNTGVSTRRFVGHTKDVLSVAFVGHTKDVLSIKVWNTHGECIYTIQDGDSHIDWVSCGRFTPDTFRPTFVSASWDKTVKVWNLTNYELRNTLAGHGGYVNAVAVSHDASLCVSGGKDGVMLFWDLPDGERMDTSLDVGGIIHGLCFCPNRYWLCVATEESVKIWDYEGKSSVQELKPEEPESGYCLSMNWSSDGSTLFTGCTDGVIRVWGF